jgi:hypothetical protein
LLLVDFFRLAMAPLSLIQGTPITYKRAVPPREERLAFCMCWSSS